jgi:hypothetical protein
MNRRLPAKEGGARPGLDQQFNRRRRVRAAQTDGSGA